MAKCFSRSLCLILVNIVLHIRADFNTTECGMVKSCYNPRSALAFSYNLVPGSYIDVEFSVDVKESSYFVSASIDASKPNIECAVLNGLSPSVYVKSDDSTGYGTWDELELQRRYISEQEASLNNGTLYCRARITVKSDGDPSFFTFDPAKMYTIEISEGPLQQGERVVQQRYTSDPLMLSSHMSSSPQKTYSLDVTTRRRLVKAHAILMVLSWFFFVPTAFLFARFLKNLWRGVKPCGVAMWFQVHRVSNLIGIALMVASFVCVLVAKDWRWTGPGSTSKYYTKVHTLIGLIALILAWLQPFGSMMRCAPDHRFRRAFNWSHRLTGVVSFALATAATAVTALEFKIWTQHELQLVLVLSPSVIMIALIVLFKFIDNAVDKHDHSKIKEPLKSVRVSLVFFSLGLLLSVSTWMTVLLANGYQNVVGFIQFPFHRSGIG